MHDKNAICPERAVVGRSIRCLGVLTLCAATAGAQAPLWEIQFGGPLQDEAWASTPDGAGGQFVCGHTSSTLSTPNGGSTDAWVAHFDASGKQSWIRQFGSVTTDFGRAVAADAEGGVFVAGHTFGSMTGGTFGGMDGWMARFDREGTLLWLTQFGTTAGDHVQAAAMDGSGGFYLAGRTYGAFGGPFAGGVGDAWLARVDASGNWLWKRQVGTPQDELSSVVSVDGNGAVYWCGTTTGSLFGASSGGSDLWVTRFDTSGNPLWFVQFGSPEFEFLNFAAGCSGPGVFVGGQTTGDLGGPNAGQWDAWVARFDEQGAQLWTRQMGTPADDIAMAAVHDGAQGAFVTGNTFGVLGGLSAGSQDIWFTRLDPAGAVLWQKQIGTGPYDTARAAASGLTGSVYFAGSTDGDLAGVNAGNDDIWLARYDGSCNPGTTYCVASSTSIAGCAASISATGSPTLSYPTGWTVSSGPVPGGNIGLLLFGASGKDNTPYGTLGGVLCVATPNFRTAPTPGGGDLGQCNGSYSFTLANLIAASPIVTSGANVTAQVWARDPANADGFLLSDGIEVTVCP